MKDLTDKQERVLIEIKIFIAINGYAPTAKDLGLILNKGITTIRALLIQLEKKGHITIIENISRGIVITK